MADALPPAPPGGKRPPKKKPRKDKSGSALPPVELSLEPGVSYAAGILPSPYPARPVPTPERVVLAPRERQNALTLAAHPAAPPGEGYQLIEFLAHNNLWHAYAPEEALRLVAAPELVQDAAAIEQRKREVRRGLPSVGAAGNAANDRRVPRLITAEQGALQLTPAQDMHRYVTRGLVPPALAVPGADLRQIDLEARKLQYFVEDAELDVALPFELRPDDYPMVQSLVQKYGRRHAQRHQTQESASQAPRKSLEVATRRYMDEFRYSVSPGAAFRSCCNGASGECVCQQLAFEENARQNAYVAREWLLPSRLEAWNQRRRQGMPITDAIDGPCGPCLECYLAELSAQVHLEERPKHVAGEFINDFVVRCELGEFDESCCLPCIDGGRWTGIEGHVPDFSKLARQYETRTIPASMGMPARTVSYLALVGQDFGVRKVRPLIGEAVPRVARLPPSGASTHALDGPDGWTHFVHSMPNCILADRTLLLSDKEEKSRVPAAWLRRHLTLYPTGDVTSPVIASAAARNIVCREALASLLDCRRSELPGRLTALADAAFCSFERSVGLWCEALDGGDEALALSPVLAYVGHDAVWRDRLGQTLAPRLPVPGAGMRAALDLDGVGIAEAVRADGLLLWTVAVWRVAVAALFEHLVKPWHTYIPAPTAPTTAAGADLKHWARALAYFSSTHDDLLTLALARPDYAVDRVLLHKSGAILTRVYPQCHRVCCFEELPAFAGSMLMYVANPWFDKGNKKAVQNVAQATEHTLFHKSMPEICQRRSFDKILIKNCKLYPAFRLLIRLILRTVIIGHVPGAHSPLPLVTRLRVNASFSPAFEACSDAMLYQWITQHPVTTLFIVREFFICTVEADYVFDKQFAQSVRWLRFKTLVRLANGDWRRELAAQGLQPIDWRGIEAKQGKAQKGRIMVYHDKTSKMNIKLKKGRWEELMERKMRAAEKDFVFDVPALRAWMNADHRLERCHLVAWYLAQRSHAPGASLRARMIIETRWLKALGMTKEGCEDVRRRQFEYYMYDTADDSIKASTRLLFARSPRDEVLLKTFLQLVGMYRRDRVALLSIQTTRAQTVALRASMGLEPWAATQPMLGMAYYCDGCRTWASSVERPSVDMLLLMNGGDEAKRRYYSWVTKVADAESFGYNSTYTRFYVPTQETLMEAAYGTARRGRVFYNNGATGGTHASSLAVALSNSDDIGSDSNSSSSESSSSESSSGEDEYGASSSQHTQPKKKKKTKKKKKKTGAAVVKPKRHGGSAVAAIHKAFYNPTDCKLYCKHGFANDTRPPPVESDDDDAGDDDSERDSDDSEGDYDEDDAPLLDSDDDEDGLDAAPDGSNPGQLMRWAARNQQRLLALTGQAAPASDAAPVARKAPAKKAATNFDIAQVIIDRGKWCQTPLRHVDMLGTLKQLHGHTYTLCSYCGRLMQVTNASVTNHGFSCGKHDLLSEFGAYHCIWRARGVAPALIQRAAHAVFGRAPVCTHVPCVVCQCVPTVAAYWVYDHAYTLFTVALCADHKGQVQRLSLTPESAPPPIRLDTLVRCFH